MEVAFAQNGSFSQNIFSIWKTILLDCVVWYSFDCIEYWSLEAWGDLSSIISLSFTSTIQ